jgi:ribosomal protein S18 acetylase RimI-like enzyme
MDAMTEFAASEDGRWVPARVSPWSPVVTRRATAADLPAIDAMQKRHSRALGFFPREQMRQYVENGWVLVAEEVRGEAAKAGKAGGLLGYVASRDRYLKRDELGVIYQLCVDEGARRRLVGAQLIKAVFDASAYGCRLYCCWCAQDLAANRFWESLGFTAIAYRAGARGKRVASEKWPVASADGAGEGAGRSESLSAVGAAGARAQLATGHSRTNHSSSARVHIFWQRRIRAGDTTTPWWFPAKTDQGALRADRLVFPIPPGLHWSDPMPVIETGESPDGEDRAKPRRATKAKSAQVIPVRQFGRPGAILPTVESTGGTNAIVQRGGRELGERSAAGGTKASKAKCDPKLVQAARELRDRWLESMNEGVGVVSDGAGKYDVSRTIAARPAEKRRKLTRAA